MKYFIAVLTTVTLAACGGGSSPEPTTASPEDPAAIDTAPAEASESTSFAEILDAQPESVKARYPYRQPRETMAFFGIEPGMTVVEALPGGGWYTKLLLPLLGSDGKLIGADYPYQIWVVNPNTSAERLEEKKTWVADWTAQAEGWRSDGDAEVAAFQMAEMPASMAGTADAVLFIRAMHNLARWEDEAGTLTAAINDAYAALKPGGIAGIIQHEARANMPDEWADGSNGYLKRDFVIARMEAAGFELVDSSEMHQNANDQPTTDDAVWRLPPGLSTSREDPELREQMLAVGESNRMMLKFRKPAA